ncbi:YihY/virulence factor BrkB family protein [soil metagenome]
MLDFLNTNDNRPWHEIDSRKQKAKRFGEVLVESVKAVFIDNVPQWAAAISYYALLSAFPLLLVGATIASFFIEPQQAADRITQLLGDFAPQGEGQIQDIVEQAVSSRGQVGLISFGGLLWTGTRVFGTMIKALNIAYDVDDPYGFFQRLLIEAIMLFTVGLFFIGALASGFLLGLVWDALRFLPAGDESMLMGVIQGGIGALVILAGFFLVYRFMPRSKQNWRSALAGASIAAFLFVLARPLFLYYIETFGNYNVIYGSLALLVILMIWVWLTAMITLFGGEVASHTQAMLIEGQSRDDVERKHRERSPGKKQSSNEGAS